MSRRNPYDRRIQTLLALLLLTGVVAMAISSTDVAVSHGYRTYFLVRQFLWGVVGLIAFVFCQRVKPQKWQYLWPLIMIGAVLGCLCIWIFPGISPVISGARRWLKIGPFTVQPVEFLKLGMAMMLAWWYSRKAGDARKLWPGLGGGLLLFAFCCLLILNQHDFGSTAILAIIGLTIPFLAGAKALHLATTLGGLALAAIPALLVSHRFERILAVFGASKDTDGAAYQQIQARIAMKGGGFFGAGLGDGVGKRIIPEAHTDFVLAPFAEEVGLLGALWVVWLFFRLMHVGLGISRDQRTTFGRLTAAGIVTYICGQAVINIGVVSGLLPCTGVPLPFISYGGSSVVSSCIALGILSSLSRDIVISEQPNDNYSDGGWNRRTRVSGPVGGGGAAPAPPRSPTALRG